MKFINFLFAVECIKNVKDDSCYYILRTNDGHIIDESDFCNFTSTIEEFIEQVTPKDVSKQ